MGERVDSASNEVRDFGGTEGILCPNCGGESEEIRDDDGNLVKRAHESGYEGWAAVDFAEANWREVGGELYCSAYCAAKGEGADEDAAQNARAEHSESVAGELKEQRIAEAMALLEAEGVGIAKIERDDR